MLGECGDGGCSYAGPFQYTRVKHVALPRSLRVLGDCTFRGCSKLRRVALAERSALERIG